MGQSNILVIEDNPEAAQAIEKILLPRGYKVWVVANSKEITKMLKTTFFPVILTELRIPGINGIDLINLILELSPETSILVMTPYAFITSAVDAMEAGAYGYITKPFNSKEIQIMMRRAIQYSSIKKQEDTSEFLAGLSVRDGLTGIYNRRFMDLQLTNKIVKLKEEVYEKFSVVMIDVDDFKKYNDTQGHQAGDEVLKELAKVFTDSLRDGDVVYRYGGEEFCIVLDKANKKEAVMISERVRTMVSLYAPATISMGVSTFPDDGEAMEELLLAADKAMYVAKQTGKNKVVAAAE